MFICMDNSQCSGKGQTPDEAYKDYENYHGNDTLDDCIFFEAEEIKVEIKIQRVETVVKVSSKRV